MSLLLDGKQSCIVLIVIGKMLDTVVNQFPILICMSNWTVQAALLLVEMCRLWFIF